MKSKKIIIVASLMFTSSMAIAKDFTNEDQKPCKNIECKDERGLVSDYKLNSLNTNFTEANNIKEKKNCSKKANRNLNKAKIGLGGQLEFKKKARVNKYQQRMHNKFHNNPEEYVKNKKHDRKKFKMERHEKRRNKE